MFPCGVPSRTRAGETASRREANWRDGRPVSAAERPGSGGGRVRGEVGHPFGEGAEDLTLDLRVLLEQVMEVLAREDEHAEVGLGGDSGGAGHLLEESDLADEVAAAAGSDGSPLALDLCLALHDHEE